MEIISHQYSLIREGRKPFFEYCSTIRPHDFVKPLPSFGDRSIRDLLVHITNTYVYWIGHFPKVSELAFVDPQDCPTMERVETCFVEVDRLVKTFLAQNNDRLESLIENVVSGRDFRIALTPLQLYTHVVTHEYHHKGQVLSMSRQLGYVPIDTDLIRF